MGIRIEDVCFSYKKKNYSFSFHNLNLQLKPSEKVCIHGATGSGKTTLFRLLFRDITPSSGNIFIDEVPLKKEKSLHNKVTFLFQKPEDQFLFPVINDEVLCKINNNSKEGISNNISELCELFKVKIEDYNSRDIYSISVGELRLLQLILNISQPSEYIILDEPTTFLDSDHCNRFLSYIKEMKNRGILILTKYPDIFDSFVERNISLSTIQS